MKLEDVARFVRKGVEAQKAVDEILKTKPHPRRDPLKAMSEEELQAEVKKYALMFGWSYYHTRDSRRSDEDFPDTVMLRKRRQVIAELKKDGEKPTPGQLEWLIAFSEVGAECYVWRPSDIEEIVKVLR